MRKTACCNDTQEIAKSFWSYSYGGLSQVYVYTIYYSRLLGLRDISITLEPAHSK